MQKLSYFFSNTLETEVSDNFWYLALRAIFFLLALGLCSYFLVKKNRRKVGKKNSPMSKKLSIEETCPLGGRNFIVVVDYANEKHLLGISQTNISHLARVSSESKPSSNLANADIENI